MKVFSFLLLFSVATTFTFAKGNVEESVVSQCCTVTVSNASTGDEATVRSCRTTMPEACDAAMKPQKKL